jgi:hypothetical protein
MGSTVKVKLLRTHVSALPGQIVTAFGHKFVMQRNGDVVCDMHKDFIPTEVAAGRVEVIEPGPPKKDEIVPELMQFSMEVSDFYGIGDADKLQTALSKLRKELLQEFASTRLSVDLPGSIPNDRMIKQISDLVQRAHQKYGKTDEDPDKDSNDVD